MMSLLPPSPFPFPISLPRSPDNTLVNFSAASEKLFLLTEGDNSCKNTVLYLTDGSWRRPLNHTNLQRDVQNVARYSFRKSDDQRRVPCR